MKSSEKNAINQQPKDHLNTNSLHLLSTAMTSTSIYGILKFISTYVKV